VMLQLISSLIKCRPTAEEQAIGGTMVVSLSTKQPLRKKFRRLKVCESLVLLAILSTPGMLIYKEHCCQFQGQAL
jgi:hypothetical protein